MVEFLCRNLTSSLIKVWGVGSIDHIFCNRLLKFLLIVSTVVSHQEFSIVQSQFSESISFKVPFCLSRCSVVKVVSMLGTEFACSAYLFVHPCLRGISILPFSHFLCVFFCHK